MAVQKSDRKDRFYFIPSAVPVITEHEVMVLLDQNHHFASS